METNNNYYDIICIILLYNTFICLNIIIIICISIDVIIITIIIIITQIKRKKHKNLCIRVYDLTI